MQNPDRRPDNPNCLVVSRRLAASDFETCFSFLYPVFGPPVQPWELSRHGIARRHLFFSEVKEAAVEWPVLVDEILTAMMHAINAAETWVPVPWKEWYGRVREHLSALKEHEQTVIYEVARSLA